MVGAKVLRIRFDKINRFIRVYDGTRYLVLFGSKKYDGCRIRYLIEVKVKSSITHVLLIIMQKLKLIHLILYLLKI